MENQPHHLEPLRSVPQCPGNEATLSCALPWPMEASGWRALADPLAHTIPAAESVGRCVAPAPLGEEVPLSLWEVLIWSEGSSCLLLVSPVILSFLFI